MRICEQFKNKPATEFPGVVIGLGQMTRLIYRFVVFGIIAGCSGAQNDGPIVTTGPSGIMMVDNTGSVARTETPPWTLNEDLRIGMVEGDGPSVFGEIYFFAVDDDGGIFVLDGQAQELRYFARDGEFVRTVAGRGEGPGELTGAAGLSRDGTGRIMTWDPRLARYTIFSEDGALLATHRRTVSGVAYPWLGRFVDDRLVDIGLERPGSGPGSLGTSNRFHFIRLRPDFGAQDTLPYLEYEFDLIGPQFVRPHSPRLTLTLAPDGTIWFTMNNEYRLHQRTLEGDTLRIVSLPLPPIPITASERDSIITMYERFPGRSLPRGEIPEHKPIVQRIVVTDEGYVLVFPVTVGVPQGSLFDVFDPSGEYLGRVESSAPLDHMPPPQMHGNYFYGVTKDELDVEYLVRLRVTRTFDPQYTMESGSSAR